MTWKTVFIVLYALVSCVHLLSCFFEWRALRVVTKCIVMPLLCAVYIVCSEELIWAVPAALGLSAIGDFALLFADKPAHMVPGIASFALAHLTYAGITAFGGYMAGVQWWLALLIVLAFLALAAFIWSCAARHMEVRMRVAGALYALVICGMAACQTIAFAAAPSLGTLLLVLGALAFVVSDSTLARIVLIPEKRLPKGTFAVMSTYILAQTLLVCGYQMAVTV
ncbi:MAG: lysoplasmalogenase [Clostridia bacterium]|nr:lysoplasmalogenase [Clostridia bacterium]